MRAFASPGGELKTSVEAIEMSERIKVLAAKSDDLSSVPGTYAVEGKP